MPKETVDQLFGEIRERLKEELDYENEARNLKLFHDFHKDQPWVLIPEVIDSHSTRRVLTLELVEGDHVSKVTPERYSQQTLNRSEEHTSELQSRPHLVCRLLLE